MASNCFGIYRAQVLNTNDPLNMGRVQLIVPNLSPLAVSGWAMPCTAPGGSTKGVKVGDGAWVMFEKGDTAYPVFMGVFPT